jgi:cysteine desulfuration protein SufE
MIGREVDSPSENGMTDIDDIVDTFELLGDWDSRYQYLVELGEQLAPMADEDKTEQNRVKACMSKVWVRARHDTTHPETVRFDADCDTAVIKGVVALLVDLFAGKTPREVLDADVDRLFERLQLAEHLSPNRHVGIYALVDLMKAQAAALADDEKASSGVG